MDKKTLIGGIGAAAAGIAITAFPLLANADEVDASTLASDSSATQVAATETPAADTEETQPSNTIVTAPAPAVAETPAATSQSTVEPVVESAVQPSTPSGETTEPAVDGTDETPVSDDTEDFVIVDPSEQEPEEEIEDPAPVVEDTTTTQVIDNGDGTTSTVTVSEVINAQWSLRETNISKRVQEGHGINVVVSGMSTGTDTTWFRGLTLNLDKYLGSDYYVTNHTTVSLQFISDVTGVPVEDLVKALLKVERPVAVDDAHPVFYLIKIADDEKLLGLVDTFAVDPAALTVVTSVTDPTTPVEPTEPSDPADPADPSDPTDPGDTTTPSTPETPTDVEDPTASEPETTIDVVQATSVIPQSYTANEDGSIVLDDTAVEDSSEDTLAQTGGVEGAGAAAMLAGIGAALIAASRRRKRA